jgi:hypothetical protein
MLARLQRSDPSVELFGRNFFFETRKALLPNRVCHRTGSPKAESNCSSSAVGHILLTHAIPGYASREPAPAEKKSSALQIKRLRFLIAILSQMRRDGALCASCATYVA